MYLGREGLGAPSRTGGGRVPSGPEEVVEGNVVEVNRSGTVSEDPDAILTGNVLAEPEWQFDKSPAPAHPPIETELISLALTSYTPPKTPRTSEEYQEAGARYQQQAQDLRKLAAKFKAANPVLSEMCRTSALKLETVANELFERADRAEKMSYATVTPTSPAPQPPKLTKAAEGLLSEADELEKEAYRLEEESKKEKDPTNRANLIRWAVQIFAMSIRLRQRAYGVPVGAFTLDPDVQEALKKHFEYLESWWASAARRSKVKETQDRYTALAMLFASIANRLREDMKVGKPVTFTIHPRDTVTVRYLPRTDQHVALTTLYPTTQFKAVVGVPSKKEAEPWEEFPEEGLPARRAGEALTPRKPKPPSGAEPVPWKRPGEPKLPFEPAVEPPPWMQFDEEGLLPTEKEETSGAGLRPPKSGPLRFDFPPPPGPSAPSDKSKPGGGAEKFPDAKLPMDYPGMEIPVEEFPGQGKPGKPLPPAGRKPKPEKPPRGRAPEGEGQPWDQFPPDDEGPYAVPPAEEGHVTWTPQEDAVRKAVEEAGKLRSTIGPDNIERMEWKLFGRRWKSERKTLVKDAPTTWTVWDLKAQSWVPTTDPRALRAPKGATPPKWITPGSPEWWLWHGAQEGALPPKERSEYRVEYETTEGAVKRLKCVEENGIRDVNALGEAISGVEFGFCDDDTDGPADDGE